MALTAQEQAFVERARTEGYSDEEIISHLRGKRTAAPPPNEFAAASEKLLAQPARQLPTQGGFAPPGGITSPGFPAPRNDQHLANTLAQGLPILLDPATYAASGTSFAKALPQALADAAVSPKAFFDYVFQKDAFGGEAVKPAELQHAEEVLQPETKKLLNFIRPDALFDMLVRAPAEIANDALVALAPVVVDPASGIRLKTRADNIAASQRMLDNALGFTPIPAFQAITQAYGAGNAEAVTKMLQESPEIALGIVLPFLVVAHGARAKSGTLPRFDHILRDFAEREQKRGFGQHAQASRPIEIEARAEAHYAAAIAKLREHVDATVPDPALNLATRILLKPEPDGSLRFRSVSEALADIFPRRDAAAPADLVRQDNLARLRVVLEDASKPRQGVSRTGTRPTDLSLQTEPVSVGDAVHNALARARATAETAPEAVEQIQLRTGEAGMAFEARPTPRRVDRFGNPIGEVESFTERPARPTTVSADTTLRPNAKPFVAVPGGSVAEVERAVAAAVAEEAKVAQMGTDLRAQRAAGKKAQAERAALAKARGEKETTVTKAPPAANATALEEFRTLTSGVSLPPTLAEGVAKIVLSTSLESLTRLNRALAAARKIDPKLIIPQLERLGRSATPAAAIPESPIVKALRELPEEPPTPAFSLGEAREAALAAGHAIDEVQRWVAGMAPMESPMADTRLLRNPAEVARAKGTGLSYARTVAASKGITLDIVAEEYVARTADGTEIVRTPIREPDALVNTVSRLEKWQPPAPPDRLPEPDPTASTLARQRRGEAGFVDLDLATFGIRPLMEKVRAAVVARDSRTLDSLVSAYRRADDIVSRFELGMLSNTELARELGDKGFEIVGSILRGVEQAQARTNEILDRTDEPLRRLGVGKGRGSKANADMGLIADTLVLLKREADPSAPGGQKWVGAVDASTSASALLWDSREGIPAAQIVEARAAWARLSPKERAGLVTSQAEAANIFDQYLVSSKKGDFFEHPHGAFPTTPAEVLTARSEAQLRARVGGHVALPGPATKPFPPEEIPTRYSAYASHAVLDTLTGGPWEEALRRAQNLGFNAQEMANELWSAMDATQFAPVTLRGVRYFDKVSALRSLMPGISNGALDEFIRNATGGVKRAHRDVNHTVGLLKKDVFVRYLQERVRQEHPEGGIPYRDFYGSYVASMMNKIHVEPALKYAASLLPTIEDPAMRARMANAINRTAGRRQPQSPGMISAERRIGAVVNALYKGVLLAKPIIGLANMTQFALMGAPELMLGKHAATPLEMFHLLRRPEFSELLLDMGVVQEALPYDFYRSVNSPDRARSFIGMWKRLYEAPNARAAAAAVADITKGSFRLVDFMAMTEVVQRRWTAAASLIKRAKELGIAEKVTRGSLADIPVAELEALKNRMVVDIGNVNFFMGRGSNQVAWIGHIAERLPAATRPILPFTAFPLGSNSWLIRALRDIRKGGGVLTPEARAGALKLAGFATAVTLIAGPLGVVPITKWIDQESDANGGFVSFMREWQTRYNLAGLLSYGLGKGVQAATGELRDAEGAPQAPPQIDLAQRVGTQSIPFVAIPAAIASGDFSPDKVMDSAFSSALLTGLIFDPANVASGLGRQASGREPTPEQVEGARRLLGVLAPRMGFDTAPVGPIPPDAAMFIPAGDAINRYLSALAAHNEEARLPGAVVDERGRLRKVRTATEEIMGIAGPLLHERVSRERTSRFKELDKSISAEKQRLVRAVVEGNQEGAFTALDKLTKLAPDFHIDPAEMRRSLRDESLKQVLDVEERVFLSLQDSAARARMQEALGHLTDPGWLKTASATERTREWTLLLLAKQRFKPKR